MNTAQFCAMEKQIILIDVDQLGTLIKNAVRAALSEATPSKPPELLTAKEVATYFKCTPRTIYNYKEQGLLTSIDIHGLVRFTRPSVEELLLRFQEGESLIEKRKQVSQVRS